MNVTITPKSLKGNINVISSKSLSHRYVIAASLSNEVSTINNILKSDDLVATKNALMKFNAKINDNKISGPLIIKETTIDANESGSTLRFLIPISMLGEENITFTGKGKLPNRPLSIYHDLFKDRYTFKKLSENELPLLCKGPLKGGYFRLPGDVSSQFISGLLFALPLLKKDSVIEITSPLESKGYVNLTLDVLKEFGIHIIKIDNQFYIKGSQKYKSVNKTIEGDFSQAAFFIVAGLIGDTINLSNLNLNSSQGDKEIIDIVTKMGGKIDISNNQVTVYKSDTKGINIDLKQIPDLGPILMVLAALSEGVTTFTNTKRLKIKESDRLKAMVESLTKLGCKIEVDDNDTCYIHGVKSFNGNLVLDSYNDHRIAMALSIASIKANGKITIKNADAINKSYQTFYEDFLSLGGVIDVSR